MPENTKTRRRLAATLLTAMLITAIVIGGIRIGTGPLTWLHELLTTQP